jgi:O-6-methylguanine DNA methyltransferase
MKLTIAEVDARAWAKQARKPELVVGVHESPWGQIFVGLVGENLAMLDLVGPGWTEKSAMHRFAKAWPGAFIRQDIASIATALERVEQVWRGKQSEGLNLLLKGTAFQRKVWRELLQIPRGATVTYGEIARRIHQPKAARAVGGAIGANPVGVLVPCHRVLASGGKIGGYAWGLDKKRALLKAEGVGIPRFEADFATLAKPYLGMFSGPGDLSSREGYGRKS